MSTSSLIPSDASIEECADDLNNFIGTLDYSESALAFALRAHLGSLLHVMLQREMCSEDQVRTFVHDLQEAALSSGE